MSACPTTFFFHFFFSFSRCLTPRNSISSSSSNSRYRGRFHDLYAVHHQTLVISVHPGLQGFPRFFLLPFLCIYVIQEKKLPSPIKVYHTGLQRYPAKNDQSLWLSRNLHSKKLPTITTDFILYILCEPFKIIL